MKTGKRIRSLLLAVALVATLASMGRLEVWAVNAKTAEALATAKAETKVVIETDAQNAIDNIEAMSNLSADEIASFIARIVESRDAERAAVDAATEITEVNEAKYRYYVVRSTVLAEAEELDTDNATKAEAAEALATAKANAKAYIETHADSTINNEIEKLSNLTADEKALFIEKITASRDTELAAVDAATEIAEVDEAQYRHNVVCSTVLAEAKELDAAADSKPTVTFGEKVYHNLRLQDLTKLGYAFTITTEVEVDAYGVLIWTGDLGTDVTVDTIGVQNKALTYDSGYYTAESDGIYAQYLGEVQYARPYVKIGDQYIYGSVDAYSPISYAQVILDGTDEDLKQLMIDLLNYGTYAQIYFAETNGESVPEVLINSILTNEQKALNWSTDLQVETPLVTKNTAKTLTVEWYGTNLNLLDAIQMNMAATGSMTGMYYWTQEAYNSAESLDVSNASGQATVRTDGIYTIGEFTGIVAQSIYDVYYVCGYDDNGNLSEIRADSVAAYATRLMSKVTSTEATVDLAKALLIYGHSAAAYFAENT